MGMCIKLWWTTVYTWKPLTYSSHFKSISGYSGRYLEQHSFSVTEQCASPLILTPDWHVSWKCVEVYEEWETNTCICSLSLAIGLQTFHCQSRRYHQFGLRRKYFDNRSEDEMLDVERQSPYIWFYLCYLQLPLRHNICCLFRPCACEFMGSDWVV